MAAATSVTVRAESKLFSHQLVPLSTLMVTVAAAIGTAMVNTPGMR